jgi:hypothetical protein
MCECGVAGARVRGVHGEECERPRMCYGRREATRGAASSEHASAVWPARACVEASSVRGVHGEEYERP